MPATNLKQIWNIKGNFNVAAQSVLNAIGWDDVFLECSGDSLPASYKTISFDPGEADNQFVLPAGKQDAGALVYDFFIGCQLTITLYTVRPEEQASLIPGVKTLHDEFFAAVMQAFEERAIPFTGTNLPYYAVQKIRPLRAVSDLDPRWLRDFTRIPFEVWFGIKSTAWPDA